MRLGLLEHHQLLLALRGRQARLGLLEILVLLGQRLLSRGRPDQPARLDLLARLLRLLAPPDLRDLLDQRVIRVLLLPLLVLPEQLVRLDLLEQRQRLQDLQGRPDQRGQLGQHLP